MEQITYPSMTALIRQNIPVNTFYNNQYLVIQPKLDGIFFKIDVNLLIGYTKDNHLYDLKDIFPFIQIEYNKNIKYLYGELVYIDPISNQVTRNRSKVMDVLLKHQNYKEYLPYIKLIIFDVEFNEPKDITYYESYLEYIYKEVSFNKVDSFCIPILSCIAFYNERTIDFYFETFSKIYNDLEGIVIKEYTSKHFMVRDNKTNINPQWFKIKNKYEATLKCVAIKPHSKNPNLIGALILESSDKLIRVSVGSGLTKEIRNYPFNSLINKAIEISFEDIIIKSKMFRHPRFNCIREDDNIDSYEKIITRIKN